MEDLRFWPKNYGGAQMPRTRSRHDCSFQRGTSFIKGKCNGRLLLLWSSLVAPLLKLGYLLECLTFLSPTIPKRKLEILFYFIKVQLSLITIVQISSQIIYDMNLIQEICSKIKISTKMSTTLLLFLFASLGGGGWYILWPFSSSVSINLFYFFFAIPCTVQFLFYYSVLVRNCDSISRKESDKRGLSIYWLI